MIRQDRSIREFLDAFPEEVRASGASLHKAGGILEIFGNHILVEAKVAFEEQEFRIALKLNGNEWVGYCNDEPYAWQAPVYAAMLERIRQGGALSPTSSAECDGEGTIYEIAAARLDRKLQPDEETYLGKLEKRFRRWEATNELYDTDVVRLNSAWEIDGYNPLVLWPNAPGNILEFWNYLAYAFDKKKLGFPDFMRPLTDLEAVQESLEVWERQREVAGWKESIHRFTATPPVRARRPTRFRLLITTEGARLQQEIEENMGFDTVATPEEYAEIAAALEGGELEMDPASELILRHFQHYWNENAKLEIDLREEAGGSLLNQLFHQESILEHLVNLDEVPFSVLEGAVTWTCDEAVANGGEACWRLQLIAPDGEPIPHALRLLSGSQNLYLSDDCAFHGPDFWGKGTEVFPVYEIHPEIIENGTGVEFLARIGAVLPPSLQGRVRERPLLVSIHLELKRGVTSASSEYVFATITASDSASERVEVFGRDGCWQIEESPEDPSGDALYRFDRSALFLFPALLDDLQASYDPGIDGWKIRVTKAFPEIFARWARNIPPGIVLEPVGEIATLLEDPVSGSLSLEVEGSEIDWFDIKVSIAVEGHKDLSKADINALVAARGGYVRVEGRGWMRLKLEMGESAREAIDRLGIDAFDMSGKTHRMHALQLADPAAKEVFSQHAWEDISSRASAPQTPRAPGPPARCWRPSSGPTRPRVSIFFPTWRPTASAESWLTTWVWARPCRLSHGSSGCARRATTMDPRPLSLWHRSLSSMSGPPRSSDMPRC